jgi:hypothetical protein
VTQIVYELLFAGHETTTGMISNALRQLLTHRQAWDNGFSTASVSPWVTSAELDLAQQADIAVAGAGFTVTLAANSVTTLVGTAQSTPPPGGGGIVFWAKDRNSLWTFHYLPADSLVAGTTKNPVLQMRYTKSIASAGVRPSQSAVVRLASASVIHVADASSKSAAWKALETADGQFLDGF